MKQKKLNYYFTDNSSISTKLSSIMLRIINDATATCDILLLCDELREFQDNFEKKY